MRRTFSVIVCVLAAVFCAGLNAQIPANVQFQPGTYAMPYHRSQQRPVPVNTLPTVTDAVSEDADSDSDADESRTEWEKRFSPQVTEPATPTALLPVLVPVPSYEVPHLTFTYNHLTGRFHIAPYEPGYAANPAAFPRQTSPLHVWVSSKSAASQPSPQVPYMSYYDPDPVVLPAEIRLHGSRFLEPFTQYQPMPLPVPKPATAVPVSPPARTRVGGWIRQNLGPFTVL